MKEYVNIRMLINTLQEAWIGTDKLIGFVEEHDLWDRLEEIAGDLMDEIHKVSDMICDFYQFSGSDDSTWDEWTDPISEYAGELYDKVVKRIGMGIEDGHE